MAYLLQGTGVGGFMARHLNTSRRHLISDQCALAEQNQGVWGGSVSPGGTYRVSIGHIPEEQHQEYSPHVVVPVPATRNEIFAG